jgi:hypothetical protein
MGGTVAGALTLLDPGPAAEAGAVHGQLASSLPGGGLAISCHKLVEDAARALVLLAPGLLRLDARPVEDTLQVMTRSLHPGLVRWHLLDDAIVREYKSTAEPYRLDWAVELPLEPRPIRGRVSLTMTADLERGLAHFVAHAVLTEASA